MLLLLEIDWRPSCGGGGEKAPLGIGILAGLHGRLEHSGPRLKGRKVVITINRRKVFRIGRCLSPVPDLDVFHIPD
jgi:hypothetical protein